MKNDKKYIYILTNKSFDNYIKVGFTDNVELKIKELNANASTPFPFKLYATYEVIDKSKAMEVINVLKDLNLCSEDTALNPKSDEMFISASPENICLLFKVIAHINNNENNVISYQNQFKVTTEVVRGEIVDEMIINEVIKTILKKTGFTQVELAKRLGLSGQNKIGTALMSKNMTVNKVVEYLEIVGYNLVVKPKNAKYLDGEIIVTSSNGE